ncbi:MAG TPA: membrane dipeptidase [Ohtaekwangia sp.]|uniref:membrane dipeptidase n=1 Tax=Ohtaekwangia sp. TaxID=2066019 RepID=UPI002F92C9C0
MSFFVDFHCHPSMKPYGKSFDSNSVGHNSDDPDDLNSIWHYDSPNLFERGIQSLTGISKFTQADFTTLSFGDVRLVCASLYPIERGFFRNKLGDKILSDLVNDFITGVGKARVDSIQNVTNYFADLEREYQFYSALNNRSIETMSGTFKYRMVSSYAEIERTLAEDPMKDNIIFVVMTIEGLHVLNENEDGAPDDDTFLDNVRKLKRWDCAPFFVTFSHHFYNHLCGHARSLTGIVGKATDQSEGMNTGFTPLGRRVLDEVLSETNGRRIYIDIKHMSALGRKEYFDILQTSYPGQEIPVIVSHGAANGLRSMDEHVVDGEATAYKLLQEDINFYDNEILAVARSGGIFGLQLDERRIASAQTLKSVKHSVFMNKIRHYRAELLWNQFQHIAELLDRNNLPAWDCMTIGSDFEGIINPINGYLTAETMTHLEAYVERYVFNYMNDRGKQLKSFNQISAAEIVTRIFHSNGMNFLRKFY